ncbi:MAG: RHS repeat-associated core domain-containing protein, partial [Pirellulales bacterium]|nr:RHS repeat-associated core domain-containing protein [Pirellulales bacterium]
TRTHNKANEITDMSESAGQTQWVTPTYDDAGNTTLVPQPADPTKKYQVTYDAWNRIAKVESTNGQTTLVAKYEYDGRHHRLSKQKHDSSGNLASTVNYFYNANWQCLKEESTPAGGGSSTVAEYVWGIRYIDDLITRDIGSERLYAMQDRQFKMIALSDTNGNVVERYTYTPYGESTIYTSGFVVRSSSSYDWNYLYTGRRQDEETGLYYFRNRYYHKGLGRFCSRDLIEYQGSQWNLFEFSDSRPLSVNDPAGLWAVPVAACGGCAACIGPAIWYCGTDPACWQLTWQLMPTWHKWACGAACGGCALIAGKKIITRPPKKPVRDAVEKWCENVRRTTRGGRLPPVNQNPNRPWPGLR